MTQERFTPEIKKRGDVIRSQEWNAAMDEIARLSTAKLNSTGDGIITGSLTVQGNLNLGTSKPTKKLQIEEGELRIQASHNNAAVDIASFLSKDLTQGLGIRSNTIAAIGSSPDQDITLAPKGNGSLSVAGSLKLAKGSAVNELSIDGTLADNSDNILPTQRAVRTYVETRLSSFEKTDFKTQNLAVAGKLEVKGNITVGGTIVQEDWQTPKLLNGWIYGNNNYESPAYFKDRMGIVHLKGFVNEGSADIIFVLPDGYRPFKRQALTIIAGGGWGRLDILPDGTVTRVGGNTWVDLGGITFRAEK